MESKREQVNNSGWKNETENRHSKIQQFLQEYFSAPYEKRSGRYRDIYDLHFSGMNSVVLGKIAKGTGKIISIDVLYEQDIPKQIHVLFDNEGSGHDIDVYLTDKALEDFLAGSVMQ